MMSIYLSPDHPRWAPHTEDDLRKAIADELISETHHLDAKQAVPTGKGKNKEHARDLASFAVDGGTLLIGVGEDKEAGTFFLAPQPLEGLAERIENIARTIPDPPLPVVTDVIPTSEDPATGYLVVHIPPSPVAPHMVEGRYWGRGDKTKHALSDADVLRLHQARRLADKDVLDLLRDEVRRDPLTGVHDHSHLFIVAEPVASRRDMLLDLTSGEQWNRRLWEFIERADTRDLGHLLRHTRVAPALSEATNGDRRTRGAAKASPALGPGRVYQPERHGGTDPYVIEVQVFENGGLRIYSSRLSDKTQQLGEVIFDAAMVNLTRRMLALIEVAADEGSYRGNWALAVGATNLQGRLAYPKGDAWISSSARYDQDIYEEATITTWAELTTSPGAVTSRLVGAFLRTLDTQYRFTSILEETTKPADENA